ncbi:MAG: hypothetical protein M3256_17200 [Actinomycetota bacterium]|nr:hypothetical protein [Actinomycetota bacterium]
MGSTDQASDTGGAQTPNETLSQFLARILDQLSITAWLPALALVGVAVVLSELSREQGSVTKAISAISHTGFAAIALLVAAVVVATMFTQAFEFEAIRILEGYWPHSGPSGCLSRRRCQRHVEKRDSLAGKRDASLLAALHSTREALTTKGHGTWVYDALVAFVTIQPMIAGTPAAAIRNAVELLPGWKSLADPIRVQKFEGLDRRLKEYPELRYRILPTRLGNVMRAVEDPIYDPAEGRLENYALRVFDQLPRAIAQNFQEERRNLDLYCGLVFVLTGAIVPSIVVGFFFDRQNRVAAVAVSAFLVALTYVSYRAALASGRRFAVALLAISEQRNRLALLGDENPHE